MRVAAKRRTDWMIASLLLEGTERQVRLANGEWVDVVHVGRGEPIVLVPGLAGGWRLVAPLAQRLSRRFEVILCAHRGDRFPLGGSWAQGISDHAEDLSAVIAQLGLERPTVLGISFGGAVALELAVEHPHRIGALILNGVEARFRSSLGSTIARRVLERFPLPSDNRFVNQFFNLLHGGKPEPGALADFVIERCWETDQSVMASRLGLLESFDVADRLWQVDVPTLVLAGSRDAIVPPGRQKALAEQIPGARFALLEGAGHVGFLTHRADIARHVAKLMRPVKHSAC
jgi:pimeloyl-ACP methyl ester carboxylesterase